MNGWGPEDGVQKQIDSTVEDRVAEAKAGLVGVSRCNCIDCGEEISKERRVAVPNAQRCTPCQDDKEWNESW